MAGRFLVACVYPRMSGGYAPLYSPSLKRDDCGGLDFRLHQPFLAFGRAGEPPFNGLLSSCSWLYTKAIGKASHEVECARNEHHGEYLLVAEPQAPELLDVALLHGGGIEGELHGEVEHGPGLRVKVGLGVVVHHVAGQLGIIGVLTEEPSVSHGSVPTLVGYGDLTPKK